MVFNIFSDNCIVITDKFSNYAIFCLSTVFVLQPLSYVSFYALISRNSLNQIATYFPWKCYHSVIVRTGVWAPALSLPPKKAIAPSPNLPYDQPFQALSLLSLFPHLKVENFRPTSL